MMLLNTLSCRCISNSIHKLRIVYQSLAKNAKYRKPVIYQSFHSSQKCTFKVKHAVRFSSEEFVAEANINTKVKNNVILYKNERTRDFMMLKVVFYGWLFVVGLMGAASYDPRYIKTWSNYSNWSDYLRANGSGLLYFGYAVLVGPLACVLLYTLNERIIRYIILHKGGNKITVITNHLFKSSHSLTIPAGEVQSTLSRENMKNYLPIKIKGRSFYFILDGQGKFLNAKLFDHTVACRKMWRK
ncbi:transmembrane protein 223-like [Ceratina calcarata]|uniref:Transmembrane protein 223-like n=1 Tax=Ceratina calcarata TaxID=156304 RepID=A0AAJ7J4A3_9HYME|nr:transmembrane protein 223-like [Ceratina calcarata]XP_017883891.1 transmembrane protein 223-like [Ceratina calcarata]